MAEQILKIPLVELAVFRLVCTRPNCGGGVVEVPTSRLSALAGGNLQCPSCNHGFMIPNLAGNVGGLQALGLALQNLGGPGAVAAGGTAHFRAELVIPNPE